MTLRQTLDDAIKSLPVAPQYFIPTDYPHSARIVALRQAKKWKIKIATYNAEGGLIIVRIG